VPGATDWPALVFVRGRRDGASIREAIRTGPRAQFHRRGIRDDLPRCSRRLDLSLSRSSRTACRASSSSASRRPTRSLAVGSCRGAHRRRERVLVPWRHRGARDGSRACSGTCRARPARPRGTEACENRYSGACLAAARSPLRAIRAARRVRSRSSLRPLRQRDGPAPSARASPAARWEVEVAPPVRPSLGSLPRAAGQNSTTGRQVSGFLRRLPRCFPDRRDLWSRRSRARRATVSACSPVASSAAAASRHRRLGARVLLPCGVWAASAGRSTRRPKRLA